MLAHDFTVAKLLKRLKPHEASQKTPKNYMKAKRCHTNNSFAKKGGGRLC